jgi:hypothetical protein
MGQLPAMTQKLENIEDKLNQALADKNELKEMVRKLDDRLRTVETTQEGIKTKVAISGGTGALGGGGLILLAQQLLQSSGG